MNQNIYDARLQHYLRKKIGTLPYDQRIQLKNIRLCNVRLNQSLGTVFLLANHEHEAKFHGTATCKNPWVCPHCSSLVMRRYAKEIGAAIDFMRSQNKFGFMITFTVPHLKVMSCRQVTDILYQTWKITFANAFAKRTGKNGSSRYTSQFNKFFVENNIEHFVRCAEYTWSEKNGWHPHFHCIFWTDKQHANKILSYEESIRKCWNNNFCKVVEKSDLDQNVKESLTTLLAFTEFYCQKGISLYISKDEDGKLQESLSSNYIAGWGGDAELTGNYKKSASHSGHLTPYQILELAADGNTAMSDLYIEFALQVTRKPVHHRVNFDKKGFKQMIKQYINQVGFKECMEKKSDTWEVVAFFTSTQWEKLCELDKNSPILSNILWIAAYKKELLESFLESFGVKLAKCVHPLAINIENLYNNIHISATSA